MPSHDDNLQIVLRTAWGGSVFDLPNEAIVGAAVQFIRYFSPAHTHTVVIYMRSVRKAGVRHFWIFQQVPPKCVQIFSNALEASVHSNWLFIVWLVWMLWPKNIKVILKCGIISLVVPHKHLLQLIRLLNCNLVGFCVPHKYVRKRTSAGFSNRIFLLPGSRFGWIVGSKSMWMKCIHSFRTQTSHSAALLMATKSKRENSLLYREDDVLW